MFGGQIGPKSFPVTNIISYHRRCRIIGHHHVLHSNGVVCIYSCRSPRRPFTGSSYKVYPYFGNKWIRPSFITDIIIWISLRTVDSLGYYSYSVVTPSAPSILFTSTFSFSLARIPSGANWKIFSFGWKIYTHIAKSTQSPRYHDLLLLVKTKS